MPFRKNWRSSDRCEEGSERSLTTKFNEGMSMVKDWLFYDPLQPHGY